ncbi:hypothetical protein, partial [Neisseria animalis]|uniref:hypothetical protein n=1 Tax=Neisseria animalis TaxID=492 RepID=UPI000FB11914
AKNRTIPLQTTPVNPKNTNKIGKILIYLFGKEILLREICTEMTNCDAAANRPSAFWDLQTAFFCLFQSTRNLQVKPFIFPTPDRPSI